MGILSNTVSICQFRVEGTPAANDLVAWAGERLAANAFQSIEKGSEELSIGWVQLDDTRQSDFVNPQAYARDHYLTFALRRDQRRIPAALLKAHLARVEEEFLAANPTFHKVPKAKREELKEAVRGALLAQTLPVPTVWDAVWDTRRGLVTFAALSPKVVDLFETFFKQAVEGLLEEGLEELAPWDRAVKVTRLRRVSQTASQTVGTGRVRARSAAAHRLLELLALGLGNLVETRIGGQELLLGASEVGLDQGGGNATLVAAQGEAEVVVAGISLGIDEIGLAGVVELDPADGELFAPLLDGTKGVGGQALAGPGDKIVAGGRPFDAELADADGVGQDSHGSLLAGIGGP